MQAIRVLSIIVATFGLCSVVTSQTTWVVGSGGSFLVIQHAIDSPLVQPGDVLQLVPGPLPHEGFHLDKALTIRGPAIIHGDPLFSGTSRTTIELASGHAQLVDLTFPPSSGTFYARDVEARQGLVSFDNCQLEGALLVKNGSRVTLNHCTVHAPSNPSALRVEGGGYVAAVRTTITATSSRGLENWGHFQGEAINITVASTTPISASGHTWIADSVITTNSFSSPTSTYPNTFIARTVTNVWFVNTNTNAPLFGLWFDQAQPQIGMPYDMTVRGEPATPVLIELTLGVQADTSGAPGEPSWMLGQASFPFVVVTTDATGNASLPLVLPMIPALRGMSIWAHASATFNGLHRSPPAGGLIR